MVNELIAGGVTGEKLIRAVMEYHRVDRLAALEIIDIETDQPDTGCIQVIET